MSKNVISLLVSIDKFAARKHILNSIDEAQGNGKSCAKRLDITESTLKSWIQKLGLWDEVENLIIKRKFKKLYCIKRPAKKKSNSNPLPKLKYSRENK